MADAAELSAKLDAIASNAAAAKDAADDDAAAVAEELMGRHAEAVARLEFMISSLANSMSAEARQNGLCVRAAAWLV